MVRPPRIELGLRVPETLVISFSLRAPQKFLSSDPEGVNVGSGIVFVVRARGGVVSSFLFREEEKTTSVR